MDKNINWNNLCVGQFGNKSLKNIIPITAILLKETDPMTLPKDLFERWPS